MARQTAARVKKISSRKLRKVREEKRREKTELLEQLDELVSAIEDTVATLNEALAVSKYFSKKHH